MSRPEVLVISLIILLANPVKAQQVIDSTFRIEVENPLFPEGNGPVILVDEAHNNDMVLEGGFRPLAEILKQYGYQPFRLYKPIQRSSLKGADILVIIGALHSSNVENWKLPTPSAFSDSEIETLLDWIEGGGSLLLVADHMPYPGAVHKLSGPLGVEWHNGFVIDSVNWGMTHFSKKAETLKMHPLISGGNPGEQVTHVASYYGSGFEIRDPDITGLLMFDDVNTVSYQTETAWKIFPETPKIPASGLYQAAAVKWGRGRVVLVAEASLFSAQLVGKGKKPVGINYPNNGQNLRFVLNIFQWLSGIVD